MKVGLTIIMGAIVAALVVAGGMSSHSEARSAANDFCKPRVARDFLKPISEMAPIRRMPRSGKLPFGPRGLTLEARGGPLVVGDGAIGFGFSDEASGQNRRLDWEVLSQLVEVDARGRALRKVDEERRRLGAVYGNRIRDFVFDVGGTPAFYRTDLSFRESGSGNLLGTFSNYVRLVGPSFGARILDEPDSQVLTGDVVSVRLANFGTETLSSLSPDWHFTVESYNGAEWVIAPSNPAPVKHKAIIEKLSAGRLDGCIRFRVPADEQSGPYRFSMVVNRSHQTGAGRAVKVTAEFAISDPD